MYTATKVTIIALALLTAGVVTAQAQNNASINVSAAVQQPIVVLAGANLTFGIGANNLPIASWVGSWNGVNDPAGSGFTPSAGATAATFSGTGTLFVFVGATVTPSVSQVAGAYVGTVQMTVTY